MRFLDVGCGMGRNSLWPMTYGAAGGLAIDLDERTLDAARRTLAPHPAVRVEGCSAYAIRDRDAFDIVFSIGVLHHLEHPELALANMVAAAKPGGRVLIWVYGREGNGWLLWALDPLRRALLARLPCGVTHHLMLYPSVALWIVLRLGLVRGAYFDLLRRMPFRQLRLIAFDQALPRIAHYWPRETVEAMMRAAGLDAVELAHVNGMSWAAIGIKPPSTSRSRPAPQA